MENDSFEKLSQVKEEIQSLSKEDFEDWNLIGMLFDKHKLNGIYLKLSDTVSSIEKEEVNMNDLPFSTSNMSVKAKEYALFKVPLSNNSEQFEEIVKEVISNSAVKYVADNCFCYKYYADNIISNDSLIEKIKMNAKAVIDSVVELLSEYNFKTEEFNSALERHISKEVNGERNFRRIKAESEIKLNPYKLD